MRFFQSKKQAIFHAAAIVLFVAGLLWNPQTVKADPAEFVIKEITAPGQVKAMMAKDEGMFDQGTDSNAKRYYTFTLKEGGWVFFEAVKCGNNASFSVELFSNPSMSVITKPMTYTWDTTMRHKQYYLEPGQYYVETYGVTVGFAYFLPNSNVLKLSSQLSAEGTSATITAEHSLSQCKLNWMGDQMSYGDIRNNARWKNTCLVNSFTVEKDGIYSVRLVSSTEEWSAYPVMVTIQISGITYCEHDYSVYSSTPEGHIKKCSKCGKQETENSQPHTSDSGKIAKEATTLKTGVRVYSCTACGYVIKEETVPKKSMHDYNKILKDSKTKSKYRVIGTDTDGKPSVEYYRPMSKSIKTLKIPKTVRIEGVTYKVTRIGENALKNCKKLKSVTVGENVKVICNQAFYGCKNLKTIKIASKVLNSVGRNVTKNIHKKATIKVPKNKKKAYKRFFPGYIK